MVRQLSNTPLTQSQESLSSKGLNYAIAPKNPPNLDYITTIDTACQKLNIQDAEELRADINGLLRKSHSPRPNLNKEVSKALVELKRDKDMVIITADKEVSMVVLEKKDYIEKAQNLLVQPAYRTIGRDPTNILKAELITMLGKIKKGNQDWKKTSTNPCFPQVALPLNFVDCQKSIKLSPLRTIASSRGSVTYGVAKVLSKILRPLVGNSLHHIQSTKDFINRVCKVTPLPGEYLCSSDVSALFTSVPIDPALNIIKELLEKNTTLWDRTVLSV